MDGKDREDIGLKQGGFQDVQGEALGDERFVDSFFPVYQVNPGEGFPVKFLHLKKSRLKSISKLKSQPGVIGFLSKFFFLASWAVLLEDSL